jgi:hypothetical protein
MSEIKELKIGDRVKVMRQIGKDVHPTEEIGTIERFNSIIHIGGEKTAMVKCDDEHEAYAYPLSKINLL